MVIALRAQPGGESDIRQEAREGGNAPHRRIWGFVMHYIAFALVMLSIPIFASLLRQNPHRRDWALTAIGALFFTGGNLRIDATLIGWPMWNGTARGIEISPVDALAVALILTRRKTGAGWPFWTVIAIYGATLALSVIPASTWMATVFSWWQYIRVILVFAAIAGECGRPDLLTGLLRGMSIGLMVEAAYFINQKLHGVVQATGTMFHQNTLGMMTELALLILIAALLAGERSKLVKIGLAAGLIIIAGGGSRGAMGIAGGGIVIYTLLSLLRGVTPVKLKMVGLGILAVAVVVPLGMLTLKERFGSVSITTQETQRAAFERAARAMAADHPLGVGANLYVPTANMGGYAQRAGVAWNFANRSAPVHNAYLLARAETGWAGELAFILLLLVPIAVGLRFAFKDRRSAGGEIALGSAIAVAVNLVHNNYEFTVFNYEVLALLFMAMAMIAAQVRGAAQPARRRPEPPPAAEAERQIPQLAGAARTIR